MQAQRNFDHRKWETANGNFKNRKIDEENHFSLHVDFVPSFSSKRGHVTEKHVLIGCKHEMFGNQTFEV